MKEPFKKINFKPKALALIETANEIIEDYERQGFNLTLRQLYYQFVSKAAIENTEKSYKNLGSIINDGRLAGLIDWEAIEDRTRHLRRNSHWDNPSQIINAAASSYYKDHWSNQNYRVEVWVEKEALAGVAEAACSPLDIPFFCCKGYTSQSEMYAAARRMLRYVSADQTPVVIHLGDHDPSGIDMSRDIKDRLNLFMDGDSFEFERIALNRDQIEEYNPPPNPAKITDSRFYSYQQMHGDKSWELDALEPKVLVKLIKEAVYGYRAIDAWEEIEKEQAAEKSVLEKIAHKLQNARRPK